MDHLRLPRYGFLQSPSRAYLPSLSDGLEGIVYLP